MSRAQVGIAVAALLTANLCLDIIFTRFGLYYGSVPPASVVGKSQQFIRVSQVLLLACWLALGTGPWLRRLVLAALVTVSIACTDRLTFAFAPGAWALFGLDRREILDQLTTRTVMFACWLLIILLTALALLLPLRRMGQWRLTWDTVSFDDTPPQFSAGDLLLWLAPLCGVLGIAKILASFREEIGPNPVFLFIDPVSLAPIVAMSAFAVLIPQRNAAAIVTAAVVALLIAAGFALNERYRLAGLLQSVPPTSPRMRFLTPRLFWQPIGEFGKYVLSMLVVVLNCLVLRVTGCQLRQPPTSKTPQ